MEISTAIRTRLDVREYTDESVPDETLAAILDAGRLAPSGKNRQHWRFVLVDAPRALDRLADISTTGDWIADAAAAVVVLTDPSYPYHEIDAGRAITYMQFAAWEHGIGSCIYTGYDEQAMRSFLDVPEEYAVTAVMGVGQPPFDPDDLAGMKDRVPLGTVAHDGRFGESWTRTE